MGQAEVPHLDLHLSSCSLPSVIDSLVKFLICFVVLFSPLPLAILPLVWGVVVSTSMIRPCVTGRLRFKDDKWHLNEERLNKAHFNLALSAWVIALYDAKHGWRLIWRTATTERSYRHLAVVVKGWQ
jgi:hypothetical protein